MLPSIISFAVCIGIPTAAAIYFLQRRDGTFATFITGILGFLISQPFLRLPLLNLISQHSMWFALLPYTSLILYYLVMGFTAGLFEESVRFIGLKIFQKNHTSWIDGIAYGLGHGGIEAAWLYIVYILPVIRQGQVGTDAILGAWERTFSIMVQIGLSMIVLYSIKTGRKSYLALAIAVHTIIDFLIIIENIWIVEGLITIEGILFIIFIIKSKKRFDMGGNEL